MCSVSLHISCIYHKYLIRILDGRKSVGYDYQRLTRHKLGDRDLKYSLILRIGVGCCLVQYNYRRVLQHRPGDGYPLSLTARQMSTCTADHGVKSILKVHDEVVTTTLSGYLLDLGVRGIRPSLSYVVPDCLVEQVIIL